LQGYGFILSAKQDRVGQFIDEIHDDSPADAAPLVQVLVALSARIFLISQISCLLPHQLNTLGLLELDLEKKMIETY
jgi:hypothetical protein